MRQGWSVKIKVKNCLKTTLTIGKLLQVRESVGSEHFLKIGSLMILNSYFIALLFGLLSSQNYLFLIIS